MVGALLEDTGYTLKDVRQARTVAAFLRALAEGQELADTDRETVESAVEKYTGISPLGGPARARPDQGLDRRSDFPEITDF